MTISKFHKGVWLFLGSAGWKNIMDPVAIKKAVQRMAKANFELMIPCVKVLDGYLDYATKAGLVNPVFSKWDPLETICREASKKDIKVHPWFCVFQEGEGSKLLQKNKSLRALSHIDGTPAKTWACAMHDEVQDYEFSLYQEVMKQYDIAGVHLDYIRTGVMCVCDYCRKWFKRQTGGDIRKTRHSYDNEDFIQWYEWRAGNVTKFVRRIHTEAKKRQLEVSAAVFWYYPGCVIDNGQDWGEWSAKGIVDYIIPMNYSASTSFVVTNTKIHAAIVGKHAQLWEGIGTWRALEQMKAIRKVGAQGAVVFTLPKLTDRDLKSLASLK